MSRNDVIWAARITFAVDSVGTPGTFYVATREFITSPSDTPPNTLFRELLVSPGSLRYEAFSGARVLGAVRGAFGDARLVNEGGALDAWMDYGTAGGKYELFRGFVGQAFTQFTPVFTAYIVGPDVTFSEVRLTLHDRMSLLDRPVSAEVSQPGDPLGGNPARKMPVVLNAPGFVPPVLFDAGLNIYYLMQNAPDSRFLTGFGAPAYQAFVGAVPLNFGGLYATATEGVTVAPAADQYRVWGETGQAAPLTTSSIVTGPCYMRLGAAPAYDVRYAPIGYKHDPATGSVRPWTFVDLCERAGLADVTPATLAPKSYVKVAGNRYLANDETTRQVMDDTCKTTWTAYGFDRLDRFFTRDLLDPDEVPSETIVYTFTLDNSRAHKRTPVPGQEKPVGLLTVNSGESYVGSIAPEATLANRELFSRGPWQYIFTGSSQAVRNANPQAMTDLVTIQGHEFQPGGIDPLQYVRSYFKLFGGRRELFELEAEFTDATLAIDLLDRVQVLMPRMRCDSGRNFRVITKTIDLSGPQPVIKFGLWGGASGPTDAVLGGGAPVRPLDDGSSYFFTRLPPPTMFVAITVDGVAMAVLQSLPAPSVYCVIEGGSPLSGPSPSSTPSGWGPVNDPHYANVIFQSTFEAATSDNQNVVSFDVDESTYNRLMGGSSPVVRTAGAIEGTYSFKTPFDAAGLPRGHYDVGAEGNVGTQAWTWECVIDADATFHRTVTSLLYIHGAFGPAWAANSVALTVNHPSHPNVVAFWAHNYSTTVPLMTSTLDVRSAGVSHIGVCTDGAGNWYLVGRGVVLDTATWSGSVTNTLRRHVGGSGEDRSQFPGPIDYPRETVGVCRYTGSYVPIIGANDGPAIDVLGPLNTLLDLQFNGADAAPTTTDSSVYAWPVTLEGGAELDTAQKYSGSASVLLNGTGARVVVDAPTLNGVGTAGLVFRIRPLTIAECILATKANSAGYVYQIGMNASGKIWFRWGGLNGTPLQMIGSAIPSLTVGAWAEIKLVTPLFSALSEASVQLYVNDAFATSTPALGTLIGNAAPITFGANHDGTQSFHGHLDAAVMANVAST